MYTFKEFGIGLTFFLAFTCSLAFFGVKYSILCKFFVLFLVGSGSLRAKFDLSEGPSKPTTLAVQFLSEGSTLSGVDTELVGTGYRLSLVKKRFATGKLGDFKLFHVHGKHLYSNSY